MDAGDYKAFPYLTVRLCLQPAVLYFGEHLRILPGTRIHFSRFAPSLSCFSGRKVFKQTNHIIMDCPITYENGARVKTSFVTKLQRRDCGADLTGFDKGNQSGK